MTFDPQYFFDLASMALSILLEQEKEIKLLKEQVMEYKNKRNE